MADFDKIRRDLVDNLEHMARQESYLFRREDAVIIAERARLLRVAIMAVKADGNPDAAPVDEARPYGDATCPHGWYKTCLRCVEKDT